MGKYRFHTSTSIIDEKNSHCAKLSMALQHISLSTFKCLFSFLSIKRNQLDEFIVQGKSIANGVDKERKFQFTSTLSGVFPSSDTDLNA